MSISIKKRDHGNGPAYSLDIMHGFGSCNQWLVLQCWILIPSHFKEIELYLIPSIALTIRGTNNIWLKCGFEINFNWLFFNITYTFSKKIDDSKKD